MVGVALSAATIAVGCGDKAEQTPAGAAAQSDGGALVQKATDLVAEMSQLPGDRLNIPPIEGKAKPGVVAAYATCTLPQCAANAGVEPAKALGWDFRVVPWDPAKGPSDRLRAIELAVNRGADYVIFSMSLPPSSYAKIIEEGKKKGTKFIAVSGSVPASESIGVEAVLNGPNAWLQAGELAVATAIADAKGKADIGFVVDPGINQYKIALEGAFKGAQKYSVGSTIETAEYSAVAPQSQTVGTIVNFVRSHPKVKYLISASPAAMSGVPEALRSAGVADRVKIIVMEPQGPDIAAIKAGTIFGAIAGQNRALLHAALDIAVRDSLGEKIPDELRNPPGWARVITKANVDKLGPTSLSEGAPVPDDFQKQYYSVWGVGS
jgi:hypothetical protein